MALKLNKLLQEYKPDIIISTHPFSSQMCAILKAKGKINSKLATIMTDYAPHNQWLVNYDFVDYFFVAHDGMRDALIKKGISSNKVFATGIPISSRFSKDYVRQDILDEFGLQNNKKTILFFAGGEFGLGKSKTYSILKVLAENFQDTQVVAIAGRNIKMKEDFENLVIQLHKEDTIKVLDYTNKVPELMSISNLVVSKPGGLTTTESMASNLPMVIINPIPGQEEQNAEFLVSKNVAIWLKTNEDVKSTLETLFNSPDTLNKMKENTKILAKRNSCRDICEIIFSNDKNATH